MGSALAPPRLSPGDRVAVIAPAGPVPHDAFAAGIALLRQRYEVQHDSQVLAREGFLAGSDDRRVRELEHWLADRDVRALFCARGGYGITRILPRLEPAAAMLSRSPRPIIGFSDVTALLSWALGAGVRGIHGPVVSQLGRLPESDREALWKLLEDPAPPPPLDGLRTLHAGLGHATGQLCGGNLEVLTRLCGTPWQPRWRGAIVLLEEVGERPYRIDRQLTHLVQAGLFEGVAGVVVGDLVRCEEPASAWPGPPGPSALEVVTERLGSLDIPVLAGAPVGHGERNRALPYGARASIDASAGTLTFAQGAVI